MSDRRGIKILIVEDEAIVAEDLARKLRSLGYSVCGTAQRGEDAVALARELKPSAVLMDVHLKGQMDGIDAAARIRRERDLPVIYLTAHSDRATLDRAKSTEPFGYLLKPFEEPALETHLEMAIFKHEAERRVRESEERLRLAKEAAGLGIFDFRTDTGEIECDERVRELWGRDQGEPMTYEVLLEAIHPKDCDAMRQAVDRAMAGGEERLSATFRLLAGGNGGVRWVEACGRVLGEEGRPGRRLVGTVVDITARKRIEDALRRSEARLRVTFDYAGVGLVEVVGDDRFVAVNDHVCEVLRRSREELLAMNVRELTWPEDRELSDRVNREIHEGVRDQITYEKRFTRGDGTPVWANVTVSAVRDAAGQWLRSITTIEDITERKKAEEELRQTAERLALAQRAGRVGVFDWDLVSGSVIWTAELEEIFGLPHGEFRSNPEDWRQRVLPEDLPNVEALFADWLQSDRKYEQWEYRFLRNGELRWIAARGRVFRDADGKPLRMIGTNVDITERKRVEMQLAESLRELREAQSELMRKERLAALGQLAGSVAHEIRTPLMVVRNCVTYLQEALDANDATLRQVLGEMDRAISNSNHIITEMLDYVREPVFEVTRFPIGKAFADALRWSQVPASVRLRRPDAPAAGIEAQANLEQVTRILVNLIVNAIQAMPEGGELELGAARREDGSVEILVRDTGSGIPEENLAKVFEPLFSTKVRGIGLGLPIARRYAQLNGGSLSLESQPGHGTLCRLVLPGPDSGPAEASA